MGKADDYDVAARERIARHIKAMYARLGETQDAFAQRLDVARPTVTNILNGKTKGIGLDIFIKAWRRLGLDPLRMLEREPEPAQKLHEIHLGEEDIRAAEARRLAVAGRHHGRKKTSP